jgi:hypothetical protein
MGRKRNRRKNVRTHVVPLPLAAVLLVVTVFSLGYLWLNGRCDALGREIKGCEQRRDELQRLIVNEEYKWCNMTSPRNMEKLLQTHQLPMALPQEKSVVRLYPDAARRGGGQFAQIRKESADD